MSRVLPRLHLPIYQSSLQPISLPEKVAFHALDDHSTIWRDRRQEQLERKRNTLDSTSRRRQRTLINDTSMKYFPREKNALKYHRWVTVSFCLVILIDQVLSFTYFAVHPDLRLRRPIHPRSFYSTVNFVLVPNRRRHLGYPATPDDFLQWLLLFIDDILSEIKQPSSTTEPLLRTMIFEALTIVDRRWAMTIVVRPLDARSSASWTTRSLSESRALYNRKRIIHSMRGLLQ